MKKLITLPKLKKKVWKLISKHIRYKGANSFGMQQCYTCTKWFEPKDMDCGHYIHNKLDFDERNLKPQCVRCNKWLHGNLNNYAKRLILENGAEWLEQLERDAIAKGNKYTRIELNELLNKYGNQRPYKTNI